MGVTVAHVDSIIFAIPMGWTDLLEGRVVLSDEDLHIKVKIIPQTPDLNAILNLDCLKTIKIKTSVTKPEGVDLTIDSSMATLQQGSGYSEVRITRTRSQLMSMQLLPSAEGDSVFEKAWFDIGLNNPTAPSNLTDGQTFGATMSGESRGQCTSTGNLSSTPPNSPLDISFFKSAGVEIITAEMDGVVSDKRQVMNQADYFYYSGHGNHADGSVNGFPPSSVDGYWNKDLDVVIFAGCSVFDINDYNNNYSGADHTISPGKIWNAKGPAIFLGYNYTAPLDTQNSAQIIAVWIGARGSLGNIDAWRQANDNVNGHNACAIQSGTVYYYFKRTTVGVPPLSFNLYNWEGVSSSSW